MTTVDAGPLVAIIDADEPDHARCTQALNAVTLPLVTTWPAFTEAMYLLGRVGHPGQQALWALVTSGRLRLEELPAASIQRSAALMAKYRDTPMDLADATLIALAELTDDPKIFTLDSDFDVYRLNGRKQFQVIPEPARAS